jgi:hypothetical protein
MADTTTLGADEQGTAEMRRAVLRMDLGQPDGVDVAEELAGDRAAQPGAGVPS